jgi:hypothetical protein
VKEVLILVEGQTEERFVKDVLAPHLAAFNLHPTSKIIVTKRVSDGRDFKGGITGFGQIEGDLRRLLQGSGRRLVTTMFDLYRLPRDVPGMNTRETLPVGAERARHIERALSTHFGAPANLLPNVIVHEFEALLMTDLDALAASALCRSAARVLRAECEGFESPELINERPDLSPSRRILKAIPSYSKVLHGPSAASRIGIEAIRAKCPHFDGWLQALIDHAAHRG